MYKAIHDLINRSLSLVDNYNPRDIFSGIKWIAVNLIERLFTADMYMYFFGGYVSYNCQLLGDQYQTNNS